MLVPARRPSALIFCFILLLARSLSAGEAFVDWRASAVRDARWGRNPISYGTNQPVRIFFIPQSAVEISNSRFALPSAQVVNLPVLKDLDPWLSTVLSAHFPYIDQIYRGDFVTSHNTWLLSSPQTGSALAERFIKILDRHQDGATAAPSILINDIVEEAIARDEPKVPLFYMPERSAVQIKIRVNRKLTLKYAYSLREALLVGFDGHALESDSQLLLPLFSVEARNRKKADDLARAAAGQELARRLARLNLVHGIYPVAHQQNTVALIPKGAAPWSNVHFGFRDTFDVAFDFIQRDFMGQPSLELNLGKEWISLVNQHHSSGPDIMTAGDIYSAYTQQLDEAFLNARDRKADIDNVSSFTLPYLRESLHLLNAPTDFIDSIDQLPPPVMKRFLAFIFDEVLPWMRSPVLGRPDIEYFESKQARLGRLAKPYFDTSKTAHVAYFLNHSEWAGRSSESIYEDLFFFVHKGHLLAQDRLSSKLVLKVHLSPQDQKNLESFESTKQATHLSFSEAFEKAVDGAASTSKFDVLFRNYSLLHALAQLQPLQQLSSWHAFLDRMQASFSPIEAKLEQLLAEKQKSNENFIGFALPSWTPGLESPKLIDELIWKAAQENPKFLAPKVLLDILGNPSFISSRLGDDDDIPAYIKLLKAFEEAAKTRPEKVGDISFTLAAVGHLDIITATLRAWCKENDMSRVIDLFDSFDQWIAANTNGSCEKLAEAQEGPLHPSTLIDRREVLWRQFKSHVNSPKKRHFIALVESRLRARAK